MPLLALDIPPGVTNLALIFSKRIRGTTVTSCDGMKGGSLQPFGGWRKRTSSTFTGISQALITYRDNSGNRRTALGTESKLYVIDQTNAIHDITPVSFTTGTAECRTKFGLGRVNLVG